MPNFSELGRSLKPKDIKRWKRITAAGTIALSNLLAPTPVIHGQEVPPPPGISQDMEKPIEVAAALNVIHSNETPTFTDEPIVNDLLIPQGDFQLNLSTRIDDPTNTPTNASGLVIENGDKGTDVYQRLSLVLFNGSWMIGIRVGGNPQPEVNMKLLDDAGDKTGAFSLAIPIDGTNVLVTLADGTNKKLALKRPFYSQGNILRLQSQVAPGQTVTTNLEYFNAVPFIPETIPTLPPTPDQQPPVVENRFQFPDFSHPIEAKIGDIETDGFEIINMGKTKGLFVTDMDYARTAIQKHFGESGKKLRIVMYDKSSDIPKNLNINEPGLVRAFFRSNYNDSVEIANLLQNYGRPIEDDNGIITLHYAVNYDFNSTTPAYSKLAGNHDTYMQEVVSRDVSSWVTGLMRLNSKYAPPILRFRPVVESGFDEELNFFSRPIFVATQKK